MQSINGLASSLVGIFIPIYLLNLHYSLIQVFFYYLVYSLAILLFFFVSGYFSKYLGAKKEILISFPFLLLYLGLLYMLKTTPISLSFIAVINAIQAAFYWFPLHVLFTKSSTDKEMGNNVGKLFAFPELVAIIAPLAGGFIAVSLGFRVLILTAGLIYLISAIPLLWVVETVSVISFDFSSFTRLFLKYPKYALVEFVENIREELEFIIWPIYVFLTFKSILSIGIVGALFGIGSFLFMLLIGRYSDKINRKIFIKSGAILMIALWIARYFMAGQITFYLLTILAGVFGALIVIPFTAFVYDYAKKENSAQFIVFREFPVIIGRLVTYSVVLFLVANIKIAFLLAAFSSVFFLLF